MRLKRVLKPLTSIEEVQASLDTFFAGIAGQMDGRHASPTPGNGGGESTVDGADERTFSYQDVFDDLGDDLERYRASRRDFLRARKAVGESQVLLNRAIDEFKGQFPWIAQALESFARMAGERELADRIRTSIRRVTRRQGEDEAPADEASADETFSDEVTPEQASSEETASSTETVSASLTETISSTSATAES